MFVVDNSQQAQGEPGSPNWRFTQTFLIEIIRNIILDGPLSGSRVGMVIYSGMPDNAFYLNR